jgi:hypothetical protein
MGNLTIICIFIIDSDAYNEKTHSALPASMLICSWRYLIFGLMVSISPSLMEIASRSYFEVLSLLFLPPTPSSTHTQNTHTHTHTHTHTLTHIHSFCGQWSYDSGWISQNSPSPKPQILARNDAD